MKNNQFRDILYVFLRELKYFEYDLSGRDHLGSLIFPGQKNKWFHINIIKYKKTFYISHVDGKSCTLEVVLGKSVKPTQTFGLTTYEDGSDELSRIWMPIIIFANKWMKTVKKDWIKANCLVEKSYPKNRRYGTIPNSLIQAVLPNIYEINKELGIVNSRKFISLVENGYFSNQNNLIVESMTAKDYFKYCKIAYISAKREDEKVDKKLSGREMYIRYADGRNEGLLEIDENSKQEFSDWIDGKHPKRKSGGHPWEIKRGGNTTHIDLCVQHFNNLGRKGFKIELCGDSINRLKETIQMFLALNHASLPISIADPEGIRKRLLAQDNIGIVPNYEPLHRANQYFKDSEYVYDVLYFDDFGRNKHKLNQFMTWKPLPLLKPKR